MNTNVILILKLNTASGSLFKTTYTYRIFFFLSKFYIYITTWFDPIMYILVVIS